MNDEVVDESNDDYSDLGVEDSWLEYLRTRLPYSFKRVEEKIGKAGKRNNRRFVLSEPVLLTGMSAAEYHNFWRRGNVYYVTGLLLDRNELSGIGSAYRMQEATRIWECEQSGRAYMPISFEQPFYLSLQLEKLWRFTQENPMDRERVLMTNISQALELCLKSVQAHAEYRQTGTFMFDAGHDISNLFESLPQQLRDEMSQEAKVFAKAYSKFRSQVMNDIEARRQSLYPERFTSRATNLAGIRQDQRAWKRIAERIEDSSYTVFVDNTDPGRAIEHMPEDWFEIAMTTIRDSMYHRYSPEEGRDVYPAGPIDNGLMLGRFMYEHLFPVPLDRGWPSLQYVLAIPGSHEE